MYVYCACTCTCNNYVCVRTYNCMYSTCCTYLFTYTCITHLVSPWNALLGVIIHPYTVREIHNCVYPYVLLWTHTVHVHVYMYVHACAIIIKCTLCNNYRTFQIALTGIPPLIVNTLWNGIQTTFSMFTELQIYTKVYRNTANMPL